MPDILARGDSFLHQNRGECQCIFSIVYAGHWIRASYGKDKLAKLGKILAVRYGAGILLAVMAYELLPFSLEVRQAMALVSLGPISAVAPAFTGKLKGDVEMSSAINSLSIIISIVLLTVALPILL